MAGHRFPAYIVYVPLCFVLKVLPYFNKRGRDKTNSKFKKLITIIMKKCLKCSVPLQGFEPCFVPRLSTIKDRALSLIPIDRHVSGFPFFSSRRAAPFAPPNKEGNTTCPSMARYSRSLPRLSCRSHIPWCRSRNIRPRRYRSLS